MNYLKYANLVREELRKNSKFLSLHKKLVERTGYSDESLSWGTWDFIFSVNRYSLSPEVKGNGIRDLILNKKQILFYGPPGTGKTYKAREFAVEFIEEVN